MSLIEGLLSAIFPSRDLPQFVRDSRLFDVPLLAVDLELTSLTPASAKITSAGWVEGKSGRINLNSSTYYVTRAQGLEQSPVIHGLIQEEVDRGVHVKDALEELETLSTSHLWIFHNAQMDCEVLRQTYQRLGRTMPKIVTLDTLLLAVYQLKKRHDVLPPNSATLAICRQRHGLAMAPAHNALDDALATLELCFAQLAELDPKRQMYLKDLMHTGSIALS